MKTTVIKNLNGTLIVSALVPVIQPTIIGYVVRYEHGGAGSGLSIPLSFEESPDGEKKVLLLGDVAGTVFSTLNDAINAAAASVRYQKKHKLTWNVFYGDYLIDPVIAA